MNYNTVGSRNIAGINWRCGLINIIPLVLFYLLQAISQCWLGNQDMLDEVLDFIAQIAGELVVGRKNLLIKALCVLVFEGKMAADQAVEDNSSAPNVCFGTDVLQSFDEFGSSIAW